MNEATNELGARLTTIKPTANGIDTGPLSAVPPYETKGVAVARVNPSKKEQFISPLRLGKLASNKTWLAAAPTGLMFGESARTLVKVPGAVARTWLCGGLPALIVMLGIFVAPIHL
ncbi:hypothetical protein [Caballeronia sp. dw_276]|uniref:hypothetical protein n=1 Tax=Caballeronia sp. dw_276 TaxID=2719795 RepID=UPI001BD42DDD|nr:hypothetical protein [Caballeronia sp. dw_276]